jgi:hypothetical protein
MPNLGSLFTSGWMAAQGEKDLAEGVVKDENIGWFSHLLRRFPLVRSSSRAAADAATPLQRVSLLDEVPAEPAATYGTRWGEAWERHQDAVAAALKEPLGEVAPRPLHEVLGQPPPQSD